MDFTLNLPHRNTVVRKMQSPVYRAGTRSGGACNLRKRERIDVALKIVRIEDKRDGSLGVEKCCGPDS
jgi:hypothetical protein